jgi:mannose-6-phosphate isomerase
MVKRVEKPWGYELIYAHTERYAGKILFIRQGERLSLQYHRQKDETIFVLDGRLLLEIEIDGEMTLRRLEPGDAQHIATGSRHRMIGETDCRVAEVSSPELSDVVRIEDAYGRVSAQESGEVG